MTKTVVVVARTKMYGGRVCVGALSEDGENIRLMNAKCVSDLGQSSPFQVGERWQVTGDSCGEHRPPHVEDFAVTSSAKMGIEGKVPEYILKRVCPWKGNIDALFDRKIQFTQKGAGYIGESSVLNGATGFWVPSVDLELRNDERGKPGYYPQGDYRHLNYVGTNAAIQRIPANGLARVSLARWWKPQDADASMDERCYAQLSGWY